MEVLFFLAGLGLAVGAERPLRDTLHVELLPGRGEARVTIVPAAGGRESTRSYRSGADVSTFRIEPGNSYLFPSSLWDRFSGTRHGPFRIEVVTRADEAVLASGHRVDEAPVSGGGFAHTVFEGLEADRGLGLYLITRPRQPDGTFPTAPPWVESFLEPILAELEARFGPLPGAAPHVVIVDFPRRMAKAFPGVLVLDRRLALEDGAPPAGRLAILAHEAAHLWWANAVRATGTGAAALQEGLAEYAACRVVGELIGPAAEAARWEALRDEYVMSSEAAADAGASLTSVAGAEWPGRGLRYARSAWVIRMLEVRVGEAAFATALRGLLERGAPVQWTGLVSALSGVSGVDLGLFQEGWIDGTGHPDPRLVTRATDGRLSVENRGRGDGEFAVERMCDGEETSRRLFLRVPAGETIEMPPHPPGCRFRIAPDGRFLVGERGPAAPPGLVLGRAWGYPVVRGVEPASAAARAGLRTGDLIVAADGQPLNEENVRELLDQLASQQEVRLRLRRGREEIETTFQRAAESETNPQARPEGTDRHPISQSPQLEHIGNRSPSAT